MNKKPKPLQILASLLIDYLRWSQLTPMILMWAFVLGMLLILLFATNQDAGFTLIERVTEWVASLPWIGPKFVSWVDSHAKDGVLDFNLGAIDFKSAVLTAWGVTSLVFMAIGWLAGRVFGPFDPWTLKRKLRVAGLSSLFVVVALMGVDFMDQGGWDSPFFSMLLSMSGMALVIFVISAWCLSISHFLGMLSTGVAQAEFGKPKSDGLV